MRPPFRALPDDVDASIARVGENGGVDVTDRPVIGIFGAGKVGTALARLLVASGYDVLMTGSPRQTALDLLVSVVAPGARVVAPADLGARASVIIVAVPFGKAGTVPWEDFGGRIVVDAMNYWPPVDGHITAIDEDERTTSEINAARNPLARVVKSLNHLGYHEMEDDSMDAGSPLRRALAVVGEDADARAVIARIIDDLGFDAVDGGALANGRALEPGHPAFGRELSASELTALLSPAAHLAA
jgi:8-hydroxy-5-deazaflavin:NADPH oxidoreductase